jgi:hypothetical protein
MRTETMVRVGEATGGVDAQADFDLAGVVDRLGTALGTARFETSPDAYESGDKTPTIRGSFLV